MRDPGRDRALVRAWLIVVALMIVAMVVVGGATRLTHSGLSITEWQPIHGVIPPLNQAEWQEEFAKYQQIPEYQQLNKGMTLAEFQGIFWWEWSHRLLGRLIGVVVLLPLIFFWATGRIEPRLKPRLVALFLLGGLQGAIGWWMVKSGLSVRTDVSQYRLATHLTFAALILAYTVWLARGLAPSPLSGTRRRLRGVAGLLVGLTFLQIFLGGLVAGLDAGLTYNTWPLMDGTLVPSGLFLQSPWWRNLFENVADGPVRPPPRRLSCCSRSPGPMPFRRAARPMRARRWFWRLLVTPAGLARHRDAADGGAARCRAHPPVRRR